MLMKSKCVCVQIWGILCLCDRTVKKMFIQIIWKIVTILFGVRMSFVLGIRNGDFLNRLHGFQPTSDEALSEMFGGMVECVQNLLAII